MSKFVQGKHNLWVFKYVFTRYRAGEMRVLFLCISTLRNRFPLPHIARFWLAQGALKKGHKPDVDIFSRLLLLALSLAFFLLRKVLWLFCRLANGYFSSLGVLKWEKDSRQAHSKMALACGHLHSGSRSPVWWSNVNAFILVPRVTKKKEDEQQRMGCSIRSRRVVSLGNCFVPQPRIVYCVFRNQLKLPTLAYFLSSLFFFFSLNSV